MKETVVGSLLLLFLSAANAKDLGIGDLPDEVIEHFKNFGLLNSLNIDKNSIEIVPATSEQRYGSKTSTTAQPPTSFAPIKDGSTLPINNSEIPSPAPYVEDVTVGTQLAEPIPQDRPVPLLQPVGRPVYIRVLQPVQVPVPQPYPVEIRVPTPVYVRVSQPYPIGIQNPLGLVPGGIPAGPFIYQIAPGSSPNGLLNSYVGSRLGGVYRNVFNPYQTIGYQKTWQ